MKVSLIDSPLDAIAADCTLTFVVGKDTEHRWVDHADRFEVMGFKCEDDESCLFPESGRLYIAIASKDHDNLRLGCASAVKAFRKKGYKHLKVGLYADEGQEARCAQAMAEGFVLGGYLFEDYKSKKTETGLAEISISSEMDDGRALDVAAAKAAVQRGIDLADSVNYARSIVNTPPKDLTPVKLAALAKTLADECGFEYQDYDAEAIKEMDMGAYHAVSLASSEPPRLIHLTYKPNDAKGRVAIVGKGLTYDSGGLSLKSSEAMYTMKADKSGGVAVLGIMRTAAKFAIPLEIHGIIGATENMIGGNAYKPDDVLKAKNGKTIEVKNTDAEGRLVLADCLCYAQALEPERIFDLATLTGACIVGLGEYTNGIMGFSGERKCEMLQAANESGELAADLPFNKHLGKLIKSEIADMSNIASSRYGGAITAGLFLAEFIDEAYRDKWLHIDIAGPAFVEKEWGYNPHGASGAGVRMLVRYLEHYAAGDFTPHA